MQEVLFKLIIAVLCLNKFYISASDELDCSKIAVRCLPPPDTCPEGQIPGIGWACNRCLICLKELGDGDECIPHISGNATTSDSICGKGLKCCHNKCIRKK